MLRDDMVQFVKLVMKFNKYCNSKTCDDCVMGKCVLCDHANDCCPFEHLDLAGQPYEWEFDSEVK